MKPALLAITGVLCWIGAGLAQEIATVKVADLRLRSGPGKDYRIIARLDAGTRVTVVGRERGWLKVEANHLRGFIIDAPRYVRVDRFTGAPEAGTQKTAASTSPADDTITQQLEKAKSDLAAISEKERQVLDAFNEADAALSRVRGQVRRTTAELAQINTRIDAIQGERDTLEKEIQVGEAYAAKRLVALYKLNWLGRVQLLATAESFFDFVNRKASLERILGVDEALLDKLNHDKMALETLLTQLNATKAQKRSLELSLSERAAQLKVQLEKRKTLLETIRSEKALEIAAYRSLQEAARKLDSTVRTLDPVELDSSPSADSGQPQQQSFARYKGLLSWPVKGKIVSFFGPYRDEKYAVTHFQSGINIKAERGEPIRAVSHGHTIFASWFKGFGNMMILDHGNHYYTVYAHIEEMFKVKGDRVDKGEVIATVGDSGSLTGPALHFEVRHHGKPVDPLAWIRKG